MALYQLISQFEAQFASIARQVMEDDSSTVPAGVATTPGGWLVVHDSARSNGIVLSPLLPYYVHLPNS